MQVVHSIQITESSLQLFFLQQSHWFQSIDILSVGLLFLFQNKLHWVNSIPANFQTPINPWYNGQGWIFVEDDFSTFGYFKERMAKNTSTCLLTYLQSRAKLSLWKHNFFCSLMLFDNLAEIHWQSIECGKHLEVSTVVCSNRITKNILSPKDSHTFCSHDEILWKKVCFSFLWLAKADFSYNSKISVSEKPDIFSLLECLILSTPSQSLSFAIQSGFNKYNIEVFQFTKLQNIVVKTKIFEFSAFYLKASESAENISGDHIVLCEDVISSAFYLCSHESPILQCYQSFCKKIFSKIELSHKVYNNCSFPFEIWVGGKCKRFGNENNSILGKKNFSFECESKMLPESFVNDLAIDCNLHAEDEPNLKSLLFFNKEESCREPDLIPCKQGHAFCFHIFDLCSFALSDFKRLTPCTNGGHLVNCTSFECNAKFKCHLHYCIPWKYVCNNIWDCPYGDDERNCNETHSCKGMFRCHKTSRTCLHKGNVCDSHTDCPFGDDEYNCLLQSFSCPNKCLCLSLAINCQNLDGINFSNNLSFFPYTSVYFTNCFNFHYVLDKRVKLFSEVQLLILKNSKLSSLKKHLVGDFTQHLDISQNSVPQIFVCQSLSLKYLNLAENQISVVESFKFKGLKSIRLLNLSCNPVLFIGSSLFSSNSKIVVSLQTNTTNIVVEHSVLKDVEIFHLDTNIFELCCFLTTLSRCKQKPPWFFSCTGLLSHFSLDVFFFLVPFCQMVIVSRIFNQSETNSPVFRIIVNTFCSTGVICALYYCIIFSENRIIPYKTKIWREKWRSGYVCVLAWFCMLFYSIVNQLLLNLMSLSRLKIVLSPFTTGFKKKNFVRRRIVFLVLISLVLSMSSSLLGFFFDKEILNMLCFPFIDVTHSSVKVEVSAWFAILSQLISFTVVAVQHFCLFKEYKLSKDSVSSSKSQQQREVDEKSMRDHLLIFTTAVFFCWIPGSCFYLLAMWMPSYPVDLISWFIVLIVPANSIAVPLTLSKAGRKNISKNWIRDGSKQNRAFDKFFQIQISVEPLWTGTQLKNNKTSFFLLQNRGGLMQLWHFEPMRLSVPPTNIPCFFLKLTEEK